MRCGVHTLCVTHPEVDPYSPIDPPQNRDGENAFF